MHAHHTRLAHALGARGAHIILLHLLQKHAAIQAYIRRQRHHHADDDGQHAELDQIQPKILAPALHRKPAQLKRKHVLKHKYVNEDADRLAHGAADHHRAIGQRSALIRNQHRQPRRQQRADDQHGY